MKMEKKDREKEKKIDDKTTNKPNDANNEEEGSDSGEDIDLSSGDEPESSESPDINEHDSTKKKKQSWMLKQKKGFASRAATSSLGKALLKKFLDKETRTLLVTLKKLVAKVDGNKKASQVNKNIIKIAVKVIVLYQDKKVTEANFESLKGNFRRICSTVKNNWRTKQFNDKTCDRLIDQMRQFEKGLIRILKPHITAHTEKRIEDTFHDLANAQFLLKAAVLPEFEKVVYVLSYYLEQTGST